jgi:UDP-3-O-[3-hydroxymyristoyl] N-acetylglucosamine deacetylase
MLQRTIKKLFTITGIGLHSGERVKVTLKPLSCDQGIVFRRIDLGFPLNQAIRLSPYLINDTRLSSTIVTQQGVRIGTIEHLMSAFCALGVDNVLVELNAPEIPIMDGSSLPFIMAMQEAGIVEQLEEKRFLRVKKKIRLEMDDKWVELFPYEGFKIGLQIHFNHAMFKESNKFFEVDFAKTSYIEAIAKARTFGFMNEIEFMRSQNLGLGGNLNNAIVVGDYNILNKEGLRYPNEFVRHKILDAIGDLYTLTHPIITHFKGYKSGHALNNKLIRKLLEEKNNYEWVSFPNDRHLPNSFHYL